MDFVHGKVGFEWPLLRPIVLPFVLVPFSVADAGIADSTELHNRTISVCYYNEVVHQNESVAFLFSSLRAHKHEAEGLTTLFDVDKLSKILMKILSSACITNLRKIYFWQLWYMSKTTTVGAGGGLIAARCRHLEKAAE